MLANESVGHTESVEAQALWQAWSKERSPALRLQLFAHYAPWMRRVAGRYAKARPALTDFGDCLGCAAEGLLQAIDRYQPRDDARFTAYADLYIRGAIRRGLAPFNGDGEQRRQRDRERIVQHLPLHGHSAPSLEALMNAAVDLAFGYFLEAGIADESLPAQQNPYAIHQQKQHVDFLHLYVERLPERERQLMQMHYFDHLEFAHIATAMGVSRPRISQLHAQALARLRGWFADIER
jgi:RNA polymerase sigma factor for flagellar operon FliA